MSVDTLIICLTVIICLAMVLRVVRHAQDLDQEHEKGGGL